MSWIQALADRVSHASPYARVALVCECADRTYDVYEAYWEGEYSPSVARAIAIGWDFACGLEVDSRDAQACLDELKDLVAFYSEEGIAISAAAVGRPVEHRIRGRNLL